MKLRELVKTTGVSKETVQFYLREGVLPKPRKRDGAQADYDQRYVDLIRRIKDLQENHYLPLSVIKSVIKQLKKVSPEEEHFFNLQSEFFSPVSQFLSAKEVTGEDEFQRATGLGPKWLTKAEAWGIITPKEIDGKKVYDLEDIAIGKLMVEMDRAGFGPKDGGNPETLRLHRDAIYGVIKKTYRRFPDKYFANVSMEEFRDLGNRIMNLMGIYFYFLYRKLARNENEAYIQELAQQKQAPNRKKRTH
jgi:DNA-binding transcriptional MerR regulator